jgi:hypothetical protein
MNGLSLYRHVATGVILLISWCILPVSVSPGAEECEIVKHVYYESRQGEIVTDWNSGIPYRRYQTVAYPCATLTIRDNSRLTTPKEIEVSATFVDGKTIVKRAWCDKKQGEEGETYSCIVCFESDSPISTTTCAFR